MTLMAAILAVVAVAMTPSGEDIKKGGTARYRSWGRGAIYLLGIVILAIGAYIIYDWYPAKERDWLTIGNMALFAVLGIGLMANNAWASRKMGEVEGDGEVMEPEIIEVEAIEADDLSSEGLMEEKDVRPRAVPKKRAKRVKKASTPATKRKVKKALQPKPAKKAVRKVERAERPGPKDQDEELIQAEGERAGPKGTGKPTCPSCDTPVDHHDVYCPVCGEDIKG